jgi:hypothetical protein
LHQGETVDTNEITLETPIVRGESTVTKITLHKPVSGALRGVSVRAVLDMDADTIMTVVPRISDPKITEAEARKLDLPDLMQMGVALAGFFMPKAALAEAANQFDSATT